MNETALLITGIALATYIPRALPMLVLSSRQIPEWLNRWLYMVAPAIFGALLAPALFLVYKGTPGTAEYAKDYTFLLAAVPAFILGWFTKSFILTIAAGMAATALLRFFAV